MSYDSYRNKKLLQFDDGRLMLLAEVSCSNVTDWRGRRCWDWVLFHPPGSLYYTKDSLKARQTEYVEQQLEHLREFRKYEVEHGYAEKYEEPTVESYDYNGTRFPNGCKVKDGRAFFSGRPIKAEDFVKEWGNPERISFAVYDANMVEVAKATYNIMRKDLDALYEEFQEENGKCYVGIN